MARTYPKLGTILKQLLFEKDMKSVDLARAVNLPPPTIHRIITGKCTRPYRTSLDPIAAFFEISFNQLIGDEPLPSSHPLSRHQENHQQIPILQWDAATHWQTITSNDLIDSHHLLASDHLGKACIAVKMQDHSMEPLFPQYSYLIIDPDKKPWDRSYILVSLSQKNTLIFRQLLIDGEDRYLKPLNPDLNHFNMKILEPKDTIIGVLVETRTNFSPPN